MAETTAQTVIQEFIDQDTEWLAEMVEKYPQTDTDTDFS